MVVDGKAFGNEIVEIVKTYVSRIFQPVETRLAVMETRLTVMETIGRELGDLRVKLAVLEDRKPEKGDKGDAGLGFDDLSVEHDGERTVTIVFSRAEKEAKTFPVKLPAMIYRGVYRESDGYERGDTVTFGGSLWHCNAETTEEKPGEGSADWTLAAKRGRDGRSAAK